MARIERTFSIRTALLILIVGSGIVAIAASLLVGWFSYREYRDRIGSSLIAASRAIMVSVDGELDQALAFVDGLSTSPNFVKGDFAVAVASEGSTCPIRLRSHPQVSGWSGGVCQHAQTTSFRRRCPGFWTFAAGQRRARLSASR